MEAATPELGFLSVRAANKQRAEEHGGGTGRIFLSPGLVGVAQEGYHGSVLLNKALLIISI